MSVIATLPPSWIKNGRISSNTFSTFSHVKSNGPSKVSVVATAPVEAAASSSPEVSKGEMMGSVSNSRNVTGLDDNDDVGRGVTTKALAVEQRDANTARDATFLFAMVFLFLRS